MDNICDYMYSPMGNNGCALQKRGKERRKINSAQVFDCDRTDLFSDCTGLPDYS